MPTADAAAPRTSLISLFLAFSRLGLTSFGGPNAHIGYLRSAFVVRRRWLDDAAFADLLALCQFLPGPASSQLGFAIGVARRGLAGGAVAWLGFTWPSALIMLAAAFGAPNLSGPFAAGALHGLKLVAVAVVAHAVIGMARVLSPDVARALVAIAAAGLVTMVSGPFAQLLAIGLGAIAGLILAGAGWARGWPALSASPRVEEGFPHLPRIFGLAMLALAAVLPLIPLVWRAVAGGHAASLFLAFYQAGAMVFGGGHVMLPLLQASVVSPGWVGPDVFLAGYGIAQALPGPLSAFAAYLGAVETPTPNGVLGGMIALIAIFLPGFLLVLAALPFWRVLRGFAQARAALAGINAAVVGILAAALYNPLWTSAVLAPRDAAIALGGWVLLAFVKMPPWGVVGVVTLVSALLAAA